VRKELKVGLLRKGAKPPKRAYPTDAGADVFYCYDSERRDWHIGDESEFWINAGESCVLPTGIKVEVPRGHMLEVKNKSGIASKRQLLVGACVIDSGYDGEVFINLHNVGTTTQKVYPGDKLAQVVLVPVETCDFVCTGDELNTDTFRGAGGFGSTGDR
jgi:dUTP pyrophosphatase